MPTKPKEALQSSVVADLKDLVRYGPEIGAGDRKDELIERTAQPFTVPLNSSEAPPEGEGLTERLTEHEALQEVVVMLRTLEQVRLTVSEKTALPSSSALKVLADKLVAGDFYQVVEKVDKWDQTIGPIKAFAWPMLLQAGGLALRTGTRLALSPSGVKALNAPPADVLRTLWRKWLKTTLLDEFSSFMQATDHVFVVAHDPWKLYLCERQYGSLGYGGSHGWNILQDRYITALIFEYAATLGMVDVSYFDPSEGHDNYRGMWGADDLRFLSRYDGLNSFRITALGAYILGLASTYQPVLQPSTVAMSVLPSLQVRRVRGTLNPQDALLLELWAEPVQADVWQLDRQKTVTAIEKGHDIEMLRQFLENGDDMPLPELVDSFLKHCARDGQALKIGAPAVLIECRDGETADFVAMHKETGPLCLRAGPMTLVVRQENVSKFREKVHVLGLGLVS